jgi:hypothetical protein
VGPRSDIRDRYRTEPDVRTSDIGLESVKSDVMWDIVLIFLHDFQFLSSNRLPSMSMSIFILIQDEYEHEQQS